MSKNMPPPVSPSSRVFEVLIAGAGPVGLTLSSLLSRFGVANLVLERSQGLPTHPQAHFINCRTMEIFQHAFPPQLQRHLQGLTPSLHYWRHFIYCTSVLGRKSVEIGRVDHFWEDNSPCPPSLLPHRILQAQSPAGVAHLSQKRLMPLLYQEAIAAAGVKEMKKGHVLFGWEVQGFQEGKAEGDDVLEVTAHEEGSSASSLFQCEFLVAADGASSRLRQVWIYFWHHHHHHHHDFA